MCEYPYENYSIDKRNLSSLEEFFLKNDQSFLDDINQIFEMGFKSITKSGSAIFFYYDNFLNFYGSKAYGVAYFQYYYSTNEQKYELITSIKEIKEKNQHWYYYEQR